MTFFQQGIPLLGTRPCPNRHTAVFVSKVACNRLLASLTTCSLDLGTSLSEKEANLQHTRDALDSMCQAGDIPNTVFTASVLAVAKILLGQERLERGVDDVEALVCLYRAGFGKGVFAENGVDRPEELELAHDGCVGNRGNLDGYRRPLGDELALVFAVVCVMESALASKSEQLDYDAPAMQTNFFALVATSFSWNRHAPPPLMQFNSSSTSSAPSNATSSMTLSGKLSKAMGMSPACSMTFLDWNPVGTYITS